MLSEGRQLSEKRSLDIGSLATLLDGWITTGPCQSPSGAFYAWLDSQNTPSFEYPEITGYALTYLSQHQTLSEEAITRGRHAANWLLRRYEKRNFSARGEDGAGDIYNFDLAMMAMGLLSFGTRCALDVYTTQGLNLVSDLQQELFVNGSLSSLRAAGGKQRQAWSIQGKAHLLKVVQCFLMASVLGQSGAQACAQELVGTLSSLQQDNGRFITHPSDEWTFLHPHLYAAEGLWMYGQFFQDERVLEQAQLAVQWAWAHQLPSGGFPRCVPSPGVEKEIKLIEQSDVTTQALRLSLLLGLNLSGETRAMERVEALSQRDGDRAAIFYQPTTAQDRNTWSTMFAAQAVDVACTHRTLTWNELV